MSDELRASPWATAEWRGGWRTVLAAMVGAATGLILYSYIVSMFVKHMAGEFGWTRGEQSFVGIATLSAGVLAPFVGRLTDRIGVRPVILVGALGFAGACLGLSMQTGSLQLYYVLVFLLVFFGLGTTSITWARVVSAKFDTSRGLALSLALSGVVMTAALMPQLLNQVISAQGWRAGWVAVGVVGVAGAVIGLMLLPVDAARAAQGRAQAGAGGGLGAALASPAFWCLIAGMFLINIPSGGLMNQMAALISDKGFNSQDVATVMSSFAISVAVGRLIAGVCLDRFPPPIVAFVAMAVPAIGCLILVGAAPILWIVILGIVFAGLSQGAEGDIGPYIVSRYFGLPSFGAIMGSVNAAVVCGTAMGGILFGQMHDRFGSYDVALWIGAGCFLIGAVMFLGLSLGGRKPVQIPAAETPFA